MSCEAENYAFLNYCEYNLYHFISMISYMMICSKCFGNNRYLYLFCRAHADINLLKLNIAYIASQIDFEVAPTVSVNFISLVISYLGFRVQEPQTAYPMTLTRPGDAVLKG